MPTDAATLVDHGPEATEDAKTFLTIVPKVTAAMVVAEPDKFKVLTEAIRKEIAEFTPDLSTEKSRKEIRSLAAKITRTKTLLDDEGKEMNAGLREQINAVDANRRAIRAELDALAEQARKPLTEWENAEKGRLERVTAGFTFLRTAHQVQFGETADQIKDRIAKVAALDIALTDYQDDFNDAIAMQRTAIDTLTEFERVARQNEANRAELDRMRAAEADRLAKEAEAKAEQERAEQERQEAAERQRQLEERQERDRKLAAEREEREKAEAEQRQKDTEARVERERQEAADKAARETEERLRREQAAKDEEARKAQALADRKAASVRHQGAVMKAAKEALMSAATIDEPLAKLIILAIKDGKVANVSINF